MAVAKVVTKTKKVNFEDVDTGAYFENDEGELCIKTDDGAIRLSDGELLGYDGDTSMDVFQGGQTVEISL